MSRLSVAASCHGSMVIQSRYVEETVYSAEDGCMRESLSSSRNASFLASPGRFFSSIFLRYSSVSTVFSSLSPSSWRMALSCWRR